MMISLNPYKKHPWVIRFGANLVDCSKTRVMGILNITPDSFFSGSRVQDMDAILSTAEKMIGDGATFLDVGGYSTRPGMAEISVEEEKKRVCNALNRLKTVFPHIYFSVDTFRPEVAQYALDSGADWINDVSGGLENEAMWNVAIERKVPYIMMHIRQNIQGMHQPQYYKNVALEVVTELAFRKDRAKKMGLQEIIIDPGFGFSKNREQNFALLHQLEVFHRLEAPILVGISRKSMIYKTLQTTATDALNGTIALNTVAIFKGAHILRVHDVREAMQTVQLLEALCLPE